ncbi:MAG: hypothetical protein ABIQ09_06295 [Jatrophihabitantaceae bacterium]
MTEQNPFTMPATDGTPATEYPVVAGAGEIFEDLDSNIPLSTGATSDEAGSTDGGAEPNES